MGFLSKLFGGDAGAASGKAADDPSSASAELESSVALRNPAKTGDAPPASAEPSPEKSVDKSKVADQRAPASGEHRPASSAGQPASSSALTPLDAARVEVTRSEVGKANAAPRGGASSGSSKAAGSSAHLPAAEAAGAPKSDVREQDAFAAAAPGSATEASRPAAAPSSGAFGAAVAKLGAAPASESALGAASSKASASTASRSAEPKPPSSVSRDDVSVVGAAGKAGPAPRRPANLESSIITSAPAITGELPRAPMAPRPSGANRAVKAAPAVSTDAAAARENAARDKSATPLATEPGLLGSRSRKDRSKSPGFYSNVAPAHAAHVVSPNLSQPNLKRTVMGVAPPAVLPEATPADGGTPLDPSAVANDVRPRGSEGEGASPQASIADATPLAPAAEKDDALPPASELAPSRPMVSDGEDKEETAPGLGQARSRHDPAARLDLPEGDMDLLVDFVMDLGLGLADESWLAPVRGAVGRLKAAAVRLQRNGLEKTVAQLDVELEAPNALSEEKRSRIVQYLVLVDLALPRPIDVPGQRLVRERLIVQHLLGELAGSHPLVAQHLREEGISSLERLSRLTADDLAESAAVSPEQAREALAVFSDYLRERARRGPQPSLLGKRQALEQRLVELESSAEQFERVADEDDACAKRDARKRRQADVARLNLFLAERGEAVILGEIERSSVQGKIARLRRWLTEQPPSSVRAPGVELPKQETTG
jgi:hypothetical protein